jgi:hypothetical protein
MSGLTRGRYTDGHDGPVAVFLIGMRLNQPWNVKAWLPVVRAMPRMLEELHREKAAAAAGTGPDNGFLDHRLLIGAGGPTVLQYWRSAEDIYRFASSTDHAHRPAWAAFNASARTSGGAVGIWHETYAVPAGGHETMYVDLPATGLAKATSLVPVGRRADAARDRMGSRVG